MSDTDIKMSEEISGRHSIDGIPMCEYDTGRVVAVFYNENDISSVIEVINAHEELVEQNKALIEALEHIKRHQEIMAGEDEMILSTLAVYNIAVKALEKAK